MASSLRKAVAAVDKHGALLVFPVNNRKEPLSLWSVLHPRSEMRWEWDETGDNRVSNLWHLRTELSESGQVVYVKWYQGRATLLSRRLFTVLLRALESADYAQTRLSPQGREILGTLRMDSPLSTKELKAITGLRGRDQEARYNRAMKELWSRLLVVAYGERDDGSFPSIAIGASELLFEELWEESHALSREEALQELEATLKTAPLFLKFALRLCRA